MEEEIIIFAFMAIMIMIIVIYVFVREGLIVGGVLLFTAIMVIGTLSYALWSWMTDG